MRYLKNLVKYDVFTIRLYVVLALFGIIIFILTCKLISFIDATGSKRRNFTDQNIFRRDIVDRNSKLLASIAPSSSLFARTDKIIDTEECVSKIANQIDGIEKEELLSKLRGSKKKFLWIKRDITPAQQEKIFNLGLPGFDFEQENKRIYIHGNLFSHVLGTTGRDMQGLSGIEYSMNNFLLDTASNDPLQLSLDADMQYILSTELEKTIKKFSAKGGSAILVDPSNGEILAMVSKPDFNPHINNSMLGDDQIFNMVSQGVYEMGSIMKLFPIAAGIDKGMIKVTDLYNLDHMKIGKYWIKDHRPIFGWHSVAEILMRSSNVGTSQIMLEIGQDVITSYYKDLGLLDVVPLEMPHSARPIMPRRKKWSKISLVTMSYGYGLSVSPLNMIQATIPIVNGGLKHKLTLIKGANEGKQPQRVLKEQTSKDMLKMMRLVVEKGTGRFADIPGYLVGGKTGTANKSFKGKYDYDRRRSSFIGIMPSSNPRYLLHVMIDDPHGIKETYGFASAGWVAAPTAGAIFKKIISYKGLRRADYSSPDVIDLMNIKFQNDTNSI